MTLPELHKLFQDASHDELIGEIHKLMGDCDRMRGWVKEYTDYLDKTQSGLNRVINELEGDING